MKEIPEDFMIIDGDKIISKEAQDILVKDLKKLNKNESKTN